MAIYDTNLHRQRIVQFMGLPIFFMVTPLPLGQSYTCPKYSEATLKNMSNISYETIDIICVQAKTIWNKSLWIFHESCWKMSSYLSHH